MNTEHKTTEAEIKETLSSGVGGFPLHTLESLDNLKHR